jgi:predicted small lipoprotein YifL
MFGLLVFSNILSGCGLKSDLYYPSSSNESLDDLSVHLQERNTASKDEIARNTIEPTKIEFKNY